MALTDKIREVEKAHRATAAKCEKPYEYMSKIFRQEFAPNEQKEVFAIKVKALMLKAMECAVKLGEQYKDELKYTPTISTIRSGMVAARALNHNTIVPSLIDITKQYWQYIESDDVDYFLDNWKSIAQRNKVQQKTNFDIMSSIEPVISVCRNLDRQNVYFTRIMQALKSIVHYCQCYES